jgi:RecA/RadA recombinase
MPPAKKKAAYTPPKDLAALHLATVKRYGSSIERREDARPITFVPTGSVSLDLGLGGGVALGRCHQVVGQPGCCKSSLCLTTLRNAQKMLKDKGVAYIDAERTWTWEYAEKLGLDTSKRRLFYAKPKSSEEVADILRDLMRSELFSLIVVDSIGGMERQDALYAKQAEESDMGKNAQVISRMAKQVAVIGGDTNTGVIFVNQYRKNFDGGMDKASGPMIMGYTTTDSIAMRRLYGAENTQLIKEGGHEIEISHKVVAKVERSKLRTAGVAAEFWWNKDTSELGPIGIDEIPELYDVAVFAGVLPPTKPGSSWLVFPDGSKENGRPACINRLRNDAKTAQAVRELLVQSIAAELTPEEDTTFVPV